MNRKAIATKVRNEEMIVAPGVYDLISAKMADRMGFDALYVTGYGLVASYLGLPDAGLATYTDMLDRVSRICEMTETPVMADAIQAMVAYLMLPTRSKAMSAPVWQRYNLRTSNFPRNVGTHPIVPSLPKKIWSAKSRWLVMHAQMKTF